MAFHVEVVDISIDTRGASIRDPRLRLSTFVEQFQRVWHTVVLLFSFLHGDRQAAKKSRRQAGGDPYFVAGETDNVKEGP